MPRRSQGANGGSLQNRLSEIILRQTNRCKRHYKDCLPPRRDVDGGPAGRRVGTKSKRPHPTQEPIVVTLSEHQVVHARDDGNMRLKTLSRA
jgi:hypothetical protein